MENYKAGLARVKNKEQYDELADRGFFTLVREDDGKDTKAEVSTILANHFGLEK